MRLDDGSELDEYLGGHGWTLLLLRGDANTARAIDALATDRVTEDWRRSFWIENGPVTAVAKLFKASGTNHEYAVVSVDEDRGPQVADRGALADLLTGRGRPSSLRIRRAFALGDQLG